MERRKMRSQLPRGIFTVALLATVAPEPTTSRVLPSLLSRRSGATSSFWVRNVGEAAGGKREIDSLQSFTIVPSVEVKRPCAAQEKHSRRGLWGILVARRLRGGAKDDSTGSSVGEVDEADGQEDDENGYGGQEEDGDDDALFGDDDEDDNMLDEGDFGEESWVGRARQAWIKTPIITRSFFKVSVSLGVCFMFLNNNRWPNVLMLDWELALYRLQLWRLITPFFYLGPVGLNFFLTAQFMWTYMSQLEKLHYREPHTFAMLLMFGIGSLLLLSLLSGTGIDASYTLGHSLTCFLIMVWSRKYAGTKVNVLDMFDIPTELLPYFFVLQSLMMDGVIPWVDLTGLVIGYFWQTLYVKGFLKAPKPLVKLFSNNAFLRAEYARVGKEFGVEMPPVDADVEEAADEDGDDGGKLSEETDRMDDEDEDEDEVEREEPRQENGLDGAEDTFSGEGAGDLGGVGTRTGKESRRGGTRARSTTAGGIRQPDAESTSDYDEDDEDGGDEDGGEEDEVSIGGLQERRTRGRRAAEELEDEVNGGNDGGDDDDDDDDDDEDDFLDGGAEFENLEELDLEMENILDEFEGELAMEEADLVPRHDDDDDEEEQEDEDEGEPHLE